MGLISSVIPNMIGGVSQQAPAARPVNVSSYELNTNHSPVKGLTKRPATDWISEVFTDNKSEVGAATHAFETANGKRFILTIDEDTSDNTRMTVVDVADGSKYPISLAGVSEYFSSTSSLLTESFGFLTVGDTTFILNKAVTPSELPVQESSSEPVPFDISVATFVELPLAQNQNVGTIAYVTGTDTYYVIQQQIIDFGDQSTVVRNWSEFTPVVPGERLSPDRRATAYIRQAVHNTEYKITVDFVDGSSTTASYSTPDPTDGGGDPNLIDTGLVASSLATNISAAPWLTATFIGSSILITSTKDIRKITATDEFGDQAMRAYSDAVQSFVDLPPNEVEGRVVRITGSVDTGGDDYYVEYEDGIWKETVGYGSRTVLDVRTMPVTLVYDPAADSFAISYHEWPGRASGDAESNPSPTFVGRRINDMFLFKGRLCVLADENVIFSEVGNYENFYRSTLTLLLETDPIDIASTASRTSILKFGVAFNETLVLFSGSQQFRLNSGNSLTPQNVSIVPTTTFNSSVNCAPISVGPNVFFVDGSDDRQNASVMEYFRNPNTEQDDAVPVTASVPQYIPKDVRKLTSAFNENLVIALPLGNEGKLYVYRYFWSGGEKVLSSWTTWDLSGITEIVSADFFGDVLYVLGMDAAGVLHLLSCNVEEGREDAGVGYLLHTDIRVVSSALSPSYDAGNDRTLYTLPYTLSPTDDPVLVVTTTTGEEVVGGILDEESQGTTTYYTVGDTTAVPAIFGLNYDFIYDYSPQYVRANGEVRQNGRLSLRHMKVRFDDTSYFDIEVTPVGRATWTKSHPGDFYTAKILQSGGGQTDLAPVQPGEFRFSCKGKADAVHIRIKNNTPYPCGFTQTEWEGQYSPKTRFI